MEMEIQNCESQTMDNYITDLACDKMFGIIGSERLASRVGSPSSNSSSSTMTSPSKPTHSGLWSIWGTEHTLALQRYDQCVGDGSSGSSNLWTGKSNPLTEKSNSWTGNSNSWTEESISWTGKSNSWPGQSNSSFENSTERIRREEVSDFDRQRRMKLSYPNKKPVVEVSRMSDAFLNSLSRLAKMSTVESRIQKMERQKVPIPEYFMPAKHSPKYSQYPEFSRKVFLGGIPLDLTDGELMRKFHNLPIRIEWPLPGGARVRLPHEYIKGEQLRGGYAFVVFDSPKTVDTVLQTICQGRYGNWRVRLTSWTVYDKQVQVIPWDMKCNYYEIEKTPAGSFESGYTVFLGGVHGQVTAKDVFSVMESLFGGVSRTELEVDQNGYPIGTAHVTFKNRASYLLALMTHYVDLRAANMECRRIQIEPFLETSAPCSICKMVVGPYFCKDFNCLKYYCITCLRQYHMDLKLGPGQCLESHIPIMKAKGAVQKKVSHYLMSSIILEKAHPGIPDSRMDQEIE